MVYVSGDGSSSSDYSPIVDPQAVDLRRNIWLYLCQRAVHGNAFVFIPAPSSRHVEERVR